jgi:hypothetical protein
VAETTLSKKLGFKPNTKALILNAPVGYLDKLGALPEGAQVLTQVNGKFDVVQLFVNNKAEVDQHAAQAIGALKLGGMLWFTYPKISSKVKTDITRDKGWDTVTQAGYVGVAVISIDDKWSALRFRPVSDVKSLRKAQSK